MKLPPNQLDGQIIIDKFGRYRFYNNVDNWINIGNSVDGGIVNYKNNGLVSPIIATLINDVKKYKFINFKILNAPRYYNYLLPNRLINFAIENNNLRIELNRGTLAYSLNSSACAGLIGNDGLVGKNGDLGLPGPIEDSYIPIINKTQLEFSHYVPAVLETEISIRLSSLNNLIEIWFDVNDSTWKIISNNTNIKFDGTIQYSNNIINIKLDADKEWGDWLIKVRQRGPEGINGENGSSFLTTDLLFSGVVSKSALVGVGKSRDNLFTSTQIINPNELGVAHVRLFQSEQCVASSFNILDSIFPTKIASLAPFCKCGFGPRTILRWAFTPINDAQGMLDLPAWTPEPCIPPLFDWYKPHDLKIMVAEIQIAKCCQEDFFFCPNLSNYCGVVSDGGWTPTPPVPPTTLCWETFTAAQWASFDSLEWGKFGACYEELEELKLEELELEELEELELEELEELELK